MVNITKWPDVLTIPLDTRELKRKMLSLLRDDEEVDRVRDLNYVVAVSSGKAVTEEIPKQIGRRAGWASQQGANFVELAIENPAQLIMDQDMLLTLAHSLNLHYNIHSSTSMAYGMAYRQAQGRGYDPAHEYTQKLLTEIGRFRSQLQAKGLDPAEDGLPRLYSINPHMAVSAMPAEEDRLAQDVSVDPYGTPFEESNVFQNKEARLGIWRHLLWEWEDVGDDFTTLQQVLQSIESDEVQNAGDYVQENLINLLRDHGYISDPLINWVNNALEALDVNQLRQLDLSALENQDVPDSLPGLRNHLNGQRIAQQLAQIQPTEADIEAALGRQISQEAQRLAQEREHVNQMGQPQPTEQDIEDAQNNIRSEYSSIFAIPDTQRLSLAEDTWRDLNEEARIMILDKDSQAYKDVVTYLRSDDSEYDRPKEKPSEFMRRLARSRRLFGEEFNKESTIFRRILPLWMPFANDEPLQQMWEGITEQDFSDHEEAIDWLYKGPDAAMNDPRKEEDVIAAATGAYVWGHFTQVPPGYNKTFVQQLEEIDMFMTFESHFVGPAEQTRIWKPKDQVEVVKAINNTAVPITDNDGNTIEERTTDQCRITIDMEHLASQKVDPLWVVDPDEDGEERGYKGLEDGDGQYILMQHVTHPYITESGAGHEHGPIQRGDTLVYEYIYRLIDKGMASNIDHPAVFMYEMGGEKTETMFLLRLIMKMIEYGIEPDELTNKGGVTKILNKDQPENIKEYLIQKYFGVTDTEVQHEWQEIFEHALDPLDDLIQAESGSHTWMGRAALGEDMRPEEWQKEQYK